MRKIYSLLSTFLLLALASGVQAQNEFVPAEGKSYSIYSYGTAGGSQAAATTSMTKKFLVASETSVIPTEGTSDNAENSSSDPDPLRTRSDAQWEVTDGTTTGTFVIKNKATGTYLQVGNTLSATPVELILDFKQVDNGKNGYAITNTAADPKVIQLTGTTIGATGYAARIRMHWILDEAVIIEGLNTLALQSAINDANTLIGTAVEGTELLQYPTSAIAEFQGEIDEAGQLYIDATATGTTTTQDEVDAALLKLNTAIANFNNSQNRSFTLTTGATTYNIYSYGVNNGGQTSADMDMTKKFLSVAEGSAVYVEGTSDNSEGGARDDAQREVQASQWIVTASAGNAGYFTFKNKESDTYLSISGTTVSLSADPVELYPFYRADDNGNHSFSIQVSRTNPNGLNVSEDGSVKSTDYADRVRMRWVIDVVDSLVGISSATDDASKTVISIEYFDLMGRKVTKENKGILIEKIQYEDGTISAKKMFF